jgi:hypothetical protein
VDIPRFIQLRPPLPPLKPMGQLQRGVTHILEAQVHPLTVDIPRFIQLSVLLSPLSEPPHVVIEPSALSAAKAYPFE